MVSVKICGLTSIADAEMVVDAGADAIGLNFFEDSVRCVTQEVARAIVAAVGDRVLTVGVFVDASEATIRSVLEFTGIQCVQLHGRESPELVRAFLPHAYKALRVRGPESLHEVSRFPGAHILLDAYVKGMPGGTGATFDWTLAEQVARTRKVTLAGGLTPSNVGLAVRSVHPFCVDVASGVEGVPGVKDQGLVRAFVAAAQSVPDGT